MKKLLTILAAAILTACGGGGSDDAPAQPSAPPVKSNALLVVGNSLTYVPPGGTAQSGVFTGGWGVAASSQDKDFAHLVGAYMDVPVTVENRAALEIDPTAVVPTWQITPQTTVIVELGDNGLPAKYAEILAQFKSAYQLICVSTWWSYTGRDEVIQRECAKAGGTYVWIGDLWANRKDDVGAYANPTVDAHPHDWGMAQIAERIKPAIRK